MGINERNEGLVRRASARFAYRGPDGEGFFSDDHVSLGHHRLAIIDTDQRSLQPMTDDSGSVHIVFNGEIYNFRELKKLLVPKYHFKTTSDTEVLLYAYREWGRGMASRIQGIFALAIYDSVASKILLLRDHAGIKPLYYYDKDEIFIFSSEIKGIRHVLKEKEVEPALDSHALDLYFVFGYVPSPSTIYSGIRRLEKSSYLEYDVANKKIISSGGYEPSSIKVSTGEDYKKLIEKKILDQLIADVPVGVFFSGGTDSSLIAAVLHSRGINLETFSIAVEGRRMDNPYFNKISERLALKSHVFDFGAREFDAIYEKVMSMIDEPSYDSSIFPTYFVSKKAAEKVKVVLSGEGGDEYFYGYPRSLFLAKFEHSCDVGLSLLDRIYISLPPFKGKNKLFQKLLIIFKKPVSYYLVTMSPSRGRATVMQWKKAKEEIGRHMKRPIEIDQGFYLENDLLRKTDMATSYASIEGRVPLLDEDIIANSGIVESAKLKGGVLKAFLKEMLLAYLPEELVYRPKSGFGIYIGELFRTSELLFEDLKKAVSFLKEKGIYAAQIADLKVDSEVGLKKASAANPDLCFALVSLYRSLTTDI